MKCLVLLTALFVGATFAAHKQGDHKQGDHKQGDHKHHKHDHYCYKNDAEMFAKVTYDMVEKVAEATKSLLTSEAKVLEETIKSDGYKTKDPGPGPFDSAKERALEVQENEDLKQVMRKTTKCVIKMVFNKRQRCCGDEAACEIDTDVFKQKIDDCMEITNKYLDDHFNRIFTQYVTEVERICTGDDARIDTEAMTIGDQVREEGNEQKSDAVDVIYAQTILILHSAKDNDSCENKVHHVMELNKANKCVSKPLRLKLRREQHQAIKCVQGVEETMHAESKRLRKLVTKE